MPALGVREVFMKKGSEQLFSLTGLTWASQEAWAEAWVGVDLKPQDARTQLGQTLKSPTGEARRQQVT